MLSISPKQAAASSPSPTANRWAALRVAAKKAIALFAGAAPNSSATLGALLGVDKATGSAVSRAVGRFHEEARDIAVLALPPNVTVTDWTLDQECGVEPVSGGYQLTQRVVFATENPPPFDLFVVIARRTLNAQGDFVKDGATANLSPAQQVALGR